ncbi:hypothetical protein Tco_1483618 [Tanacetum coccineum]
MFGTIPTTISDTTPVITPPTTQTDTTVIPIKTPIKAPTIPPSSDYTPASLDYSPTSDSEFDPSEDPSSDHIPPLPAISPFLSSADDTTNSDTSDTPPSPTHGTPFTEITSSTQRSPVIPRRRVMILAPGQPIPHDFHSDASSDSSSRHSLFDHSSPDLLSDHSSPDLPSTSAGPSRKRHVEVDPRETSLRDDIIVMDSDEQSRSIGTDIEVGDDVKRSDEMDINPVKVVIEACFDFADIIKASGVNVRVKAVIVAQDDVKMGTRDSIVVSDDGDTPPVVPEVIPDPAQERAVRGTYETLGSLVQRFHDHTQAIPVHQIQVIKGVQREKMPNIRSGASMTHEEVEELVTRRVAKEMEAHEAARTFEPLNENGDEQEGKNGGNGNGVEKFCKYGDGGGLKSAATRIKGGGVGWFFACVGRIRE